MKVLWKNLFLATTVTSLYWGSLCASPADLDGDGLVNSTDLSELIASWGTCNQCPADLTGDGSVDAFDLAELLSNWDSTPEPLPEIQFSPSFAERSRVRFTRHENASFEISLPDIDLYERSDNGERRYEIDWKISPTNNTEFVDLSDGEQTWGHIYGSNSPILNIANIRPINGSWEFALKAIVTETGSGASSEGILAPIELSGELNSFGIEASVRLSTEVQENPNQITVSWAGFRNTSTYSIRKRELSGDWMELANGLTENNFVDTNVQVGRIYEYEVMGLVEDSNFQDQLGHIRSGIKIAPKDFRGKLILVRDMSLYNFDDATQQSIDRYVRELQLDGWAVSTIDYQRGSNEFFDARNLKKNQILPTYLSDPENFKAVILLGDIPVPHSGDQNIDGHFRRSLPADVYYGEMNGNWTDNQVDYASCNPYICRDDYWREDWRHINLLGDSIFDQEFLPNSAPSNAGMMLNTAGDLEMAVSRIDFSHLPGFQQALGASSSLETEALLTRRYLQKLSDYKNDVWKVPNRAAVADRFGGLTRWPSSLAWRNFSAILGYEKISTVSGRFQSVAPISEYLNRNSFKYFQASGAGTPSRIADGYGDFSSDQLISQSFHGVFNFLYGSYLHDFEYSINSTNALMKSILASEGKGLTAVWADGDYDSFHFHSLGLGASFVDAYVDTWNSNYTNPVYRVTGEFSEGDPASDFTYVRKAALGGCNLLGDATLRSEVVPTVDNLSYVENTNGLELSWEDPSAEIDHYRVFQMQDGVPSLIGTTEDTSFTITSPQSGARYQVRATKLIESNSGSYYESSLGRELTLSN